VHFVAINSSLGIVCFQVLFFHFPNVFQFSWFLVLFAAAIAKDDDGEGGGNKFGCNGYSEGFLDQIEPNGNILSGKQHSSTSDATFGKKQRQRTETGTQFPLFYWTETLFRKKVNKDNAKTEKKDGASSFQFHFDRSFPYEQHNKGDRYSQE